MSLPTPLLTAVANHGCFTGCYKPDRAASVCLDPAQPLAATFLAVCSECLSFRVGALTTALGLGVTAQAFADELSAQVQGLRGYVWSTSGYWANGGFWISAVYFGNGLFLVDGSRNGGQRTDLDMLIHAFRAGVVAPEDPRMVTPSHYTSEVVYVDMPQLMGLVRDKHDLLASPACRKMRLHGYQRASLLEFVPMALGNPLPPNPGLGMAPSVRPSAPPPPTVRSATPLGPSPASAAPAPKAAPESEADGGVCCPDCGEEIKERPLFVGTYVGCLC
jgi:hypothetical protein